MAQPETIEEKMMRLAAAARKLPGFGKPLPPVCRRSVKSLPARTARPAGECHRGMPPESESNPAFEAADRMRDGGRRPEDGSQMAEKPDGATIPGLMSAGDRQEDFKASGAAASANARLMEFFDLPHNFGKWFPRTALKEIARNDYINNRADDLREHYIPKGFYIDNYMIADGPERPKTSHYRICKIADALSLTKAQKFKLIHGYDMPQEGQRTLPVEEP